MQLHEDVALILARRETCKYPKMLPTTVIWVKGAASANCVLARLVVETVEPVQLSGGAFRRQLEVDFHVGSVHRFEAGFH